MIKIFYGIIATVLLCNDISVAQTLKSSGTIQKNASFVASKTISSTDNLLLKDENYSNFFELKSFDLKSTTLNYSFDKIESKGIVYILKSVYDENKNIKSISISSSNPSKLALDIQNVSNESSITSAFSCTRYEYTLVGCILTLLGF